MTEGIENSNSLAFMHPNRIVSKNVWLLLNSSITEKIKNTENIMTKDVSNALRIFVIKNLCISIFFI